MLFAETALQDQILDPLAQLARMVNMEYLNSVDLAIQIAESALTGDLLLV